MLAWYGDLSAVREEGVAGPCRIRYVEVDAWARLTDSRPTPHEVQLLLDLDAAFFRARAAVEEERQLDAHLAGG